MLLPPVGATGATAACTSRPPPLAADSSSWRAGAGARLLALVVGAVLETKRLEKIIAEMKLNHLQQVHTHTRTRTQKSKEATLK